MSNLRVTRRTFVQGTAASAFAFTVLPSRVWGANERINLACIGIGGKGAGEVTDLSAAGANIVALCDVDDNRRVRKGQDARDLHPRATFYRDFREMLDREDKTIDAVSVSTPDHVHCHASVLAMRHGKHVYCQKPLTRTIAEARLMARTAREQHVATQMGNQAHAGEPIRRGVELIRAGLIGKVTEVHCWTNRPIWPQGLTARPAPEAVPSRAGLGPVARADGRASVQLGLLPLQVAGLVGLRHRCPRRHGLPHHGHALLGARPEVSDPRRGRVRGEHPPLRPDRRDRHAITSRPARTAATCRSSGTTATACPRPKYSPGSTCRRTRSPGGSTWS